METMTLKAEPRTELGTRASGQIRKAGRMPVVIYGHGEPPETVSLVQHDVEVALAQGSRTLGVDVGGTVKQYLIKEVQYDHLGQTAIHLDLARVDLDERVTVRVSIELRGVPKGASEGGMLEQLMPDIEVECLVTEIPETLRPVVTELNVGDSLLVKDLELPARVNAVTGSEERVATVRALAIAAEVEEEPEAAAEDSEGPERIGRVRKEEEAKDGGAS